MNRLATSLLHAFVVPISIVFSVACGQKPAELRIDGELPKVVFGALPVALPKPLVLDAKGRALQKQPAVVIDCRPSDVALIQDQQLIPLTSGAVEIRYRLADAALQAVHNLTITLVDRVELECPEDGCDLSTGDKAEMRARFLQGDQALQGVSAEWKSSAPAVVEIDAAGSVLAKSGGETTITVRVGAFEAKARLSVLGRGTPDVVTLACKKESINIFDAQGGCAVRLGVPTGVDLSASAAGAPVVVPKLEWSAANPEIAEVRQGSQAELVGLALGTTVVTGRAGALETSLEVTVIPPLCSESHVETFRRQMERGASVSMVCKMEGAEKCFFHYVDRKLPVPAQVEEGLERCCCEIKVKEAEPEEEAFETE